MPIIAQAPESIYECTLLNVLRSKGSSGSGLYEKVVSFIKIASPLVDLTISGPFRNYTLHNREHSKKIIHLAGFLLPLAMIESMSELDLVIFIYAAFVHDMGMSLTSVERDRIIQLPAFTDGIQSWPALAEAYTSTNLRLAAAQLPHEREVVASELYELQEAALANYLRPRHGSPDRYRELIARINKASDRQDLFTHRGTSFEDIFVEVCASHILDVSVLSETKSAYAERFPRRAALGGLYLNAQFCAALLRITDILDFDRERTPKILFESLGIAGRSIPGAEVSLLEWQKHLSIHSVEINPQEFVISAQVRHPVIERSIRDFCALIEREIRDTLAILRRNPTEITQIYLPELPIIVRAHITPIGYVYREMALSLNQSRILHLLMGERLYTNPAVALRELVQNSMDACLVREGLEGKSYQPQINVSDEVDANGKYWLVIRDNGTGMDEHILSEYFLTLGNSYYRSAEFHRRAPTYKPISRFGIGIAAVFLIADVLELRTRSSSSPRGDDQGRCVRIEGVLSLAFVTESMSISPGTEVRLMIKTEFAADPLNFARMCFEYLQTAIMQPRVRVAMNLAGMAHTICGEAGLKARADASTALAAKDLELVLLDMARWSDRFQGSVGFFLHVSPDGKLSHLRDGRYVRTTRASLDPRDYLVTYPGNRIAVNGFSMSLKGLGKIFGRGKERLAMVYSLDVLGDDDVEYDISRQRVIGTGKHSVLETLERAVVSGFEGMGVFNRLEEVTKRVFTATKIKPATDTASYYKQFKPVSDGELLDKVFTLMPASPWHIGIHKKIAKELSISNNLAGRSISTLIALGRLVAQPYSNPHNSER